jgi:hypothetical protein
MAFDSTLGLPLLTRDCKNLEEAWAQGGKSATPQRQALKDGPRPASVLGPETTCAGQRQKNPRLSLRA